MQPASWFLSVCFWRDSPQWARTSSFTRFLDHTQRTHHSRQDFSGRVISSSQRLLPDNTRHSQLANIHAPGGIRTNNLGRRAAADLRLKPRGHRDRQLLCFAFLKGNLLGLVFLKGTPLPSFLPSFLPHYKHSVLPSLNSCT